MEKAELDELTARVGALELLVRTLLSRAFLGDSTFAEIMNNVAFTPDPEDEEVTDPDMRLRLSMFRFAIQEAVGSAQETSSGWTAAAAKRSPLHRGE